MISTNAGKASSSHCVAISNRNSREWNDARAGANDVFTSPASGQIHLILNQARRRIDTAYSKLQNAESYVETIENTLQIEERWTEASPEYKAFFQETVLTNYERALDDLERLVVMRLFELAKMSSSGTGTPFALLLKYVKQTLLGYKLRRQIGKALQRRSEAIKNAINRYNIQAAKLTPPRTPLSWKEIVEYSFLGEFDALRHSTRGVRDQLWAQATRREAMVKHFKLCRAREEITRLNIEIRRLRTSIHHETLHTNKAILHLTETNPHLAVELKSRWQLRDAINTLHLQRLDSVERSAGFTGACGIGVPVFTPTGPNPSDNIPYEAMTDSGLGGTRYETKNDSEMDDAAEDVVHDLEKITEFVLAITD
jgi:hypothetical protein